MDDFEYSVHISDQDWHSFFLECEECNMLPPVLAGMEDSGMSDMDEIASHRARMDRESRVPEPELQTSSPDHESPVDLYLNRCSMSSPLQILSGSEDDLHMESVNMFFEKLKNVSAREDPLTQRYHFKAGTEVTANLKESVETVNIETQSNGGPATQKNESNFLIKDRMKCDELCKEMRPKSDNGKTPCCALVKGKDLAGPNQEDSYSKELVSQGQTSSTTPKRKRRKKKRSSTEQAEGHEVQFQARQSESDDDIFVRRKEIDREICPSGDWSLGTVPEVGNAPHILLLPPKIDSIFESFSVQPQSLPGNVVDPAVACPDSPVTHQESLESPSTITTAQNKGGLDFMHGKSELTGKPGSAGLFAITVNLTSTETGVPVKMTGTLTLQSNECTSAPTNGDNVGSNLQLNSHLPLEIKAALNGSEASPTSITTCDEVAVESQTAGKPGSTENPLLRYRREMNENDKSSISHHTGNSQVNSTALIPAVLLPSDPAVCSKALNNPQAQNQVGVTVTLSDAQCAASQWETSAPANVSCVIFPEKMAFSPSCKNAEKKQNVTCLTHEVVSPVYRYGFDFPSHESSKLVTRSDLVNTVTAQISLQNLQMQANVSADRNNCSSLTETKSEESGVIISNKSEKDSSSSLRPMDIANLPGIPLKEGEPPAADNQNGGLSLKKSSKYQLLISSPEGEPNESSKPSTLSTADEQNYEVNHVPLHCPSNDHELPASTILQSMAVVILESAQGARGLETGGDRVSSHLQSEDLTEEVFSFIRSKDVTDLPQSLQDINVEKVGIVSLSAEERNEGLQPRQSQFVEDAKQHLSLTTSDEEKGEDHYVSPPILASKDDESSLNIVTQSKASSTPQPNDGSKHILSGIATGNEKNREVHKLAPNCPSKDQELSPVQGMASPIDEPTQGANSLETVFTTDEPNNEVNHVPLHCPSNDHELSSSTLMQCTAYPIHETENGRLFLQSQCEDLTEDISSFIRSNNMTESPQSKNGIAVERIGILSPASENRNEILHAKKSQLGEDAQLQHFFLTTSDEKKDEELYLSPHCPAKDHKLLSTVMMRGTTPGSMDGAEYPSSNIITTADKEENKVQYVPTIGPSKDHESSPSAGTETTVQSYILKLNDGAKHISSDITTTGGKVNAHCVPPHCSSKDFELSPSTSTESSTPKSNNEAKHITSDITSARDKENYYVHYLPAHCPSQDRALSPSAITHGTASFTSESNDGTKHISTSITTTGGVEKVEAHYVPPHCLSKDLKLSPSVSTESSTSESNDEVKHISTSITTTGGVEKVEAPPHCPPRCLSKDLKLTPSVATESSTSESNDGAKHISTLSIDHALSSGAIMPNNDSPVLESVKHAMNLEDGGLSLYLQSEGRTERTSASIQPKRIPESPGSSTNVQSRNYQPFIEITGTEGLLGVDSKSERSSDICITANKEKAKADCPLINHELSQVVSPTSPANRVEHTLLSINASDKEKRQVQNVPPNFPSKEQELSSSEIMDDITSPSPEPMEGARSLETIDAVSQSPHPVYAISSFWNEMEKLTINDILRLRLVGQAQHPSVLLQSEDSGIADVSDAADSGYFTHFDDSKPDRSSGDMSYISDFDEELAQLQTLEAAKLDEGSRESPNLEDAMWDSEPGPCGPGAGMEDVLMLSSETALHSPLYKDNAQQCFRKMCKNISVQNLQALEAQPFRKILRNASLLSLHSVHSTHSIHADFEDDYIDPFDRVDASTPVCLSDEEEDEMGSTGITFTEIIQYLFGEDEPECCTSAADNVLPSYLDGTETSVPETYDHFFSEFEDGSLFNPLTDNSKSSSNELVPIFSCSRSANRNLQFPEVYDYFFPDDSPVHSDEDEEHDQTVIQVVTRHDHMAAMHHNAMAESDTYEEVPPETEGYSGYVWNFLRNNPLSFRRVRRSDFTAPPEKSSSRALTPVKNSRTSLQRGIQPINAMGPDEKPFPDPLLFSLENRIFRQLANQQNIRNEMQTAVADPRTDAALMPLKQADMCLVCIAFASWVLKSANPQGADMWKAALLANVSALSAIRYLRRYMRDEAAKKAPLRQIEPA